MDRPPRWRANKRKGSHEYSIQEWPQDGPEWQRGMPPLIMRRRVDAGPNDPAPASSMPVVRTARQADSADGEPYIAGQGVRYTIPKANVQQNKYVTTALLMGANASVGQAGELVNGMSQGTDNGQRIGRSIRIIGWEYRVKVTNVVAVLDKRIWGGNAGVAQTLRDIPPWHAGAGDLPNLPIPGVDPPLTYGMEGVAPGAFLGIPCPNISDHPTGFDYQKEQKDVVNQQEIPPFPPIDINDSDSRNRVTDTRIMVVLDRTPKLGVPLWSDIMETLFVAPVMNAVTGLYDIAALSRFEVIHDNTFTPQFGATGVTIIQHMKVCKIDVVFNDNTSATDETGIEENAMYFFVATGDLTGVSPVPPFNFSVDGFFRILYSDS